MWGNRAAEGLFGRTRDESIGMSGLDLIHPEDLEFVLRSLVSVRGKDVGSPIEVRVATASGWRLVELVGYPGPVVQRRCRAPVPSGPDRAAALRARPPSRRPSASLVHNSSSITMLVSPEGTVVSVSGALTRLLGHDPELVEGTTAGRPGQRSRPSHPRGGIRMCRLRGHGGQSGDRQVGPQAPRRREDFPVRAGAGQPGRRSDRRRLRGVRPRHHHPDAHRARGAQGAVPVDGHTGLDG